MTSTTSRDASTAPAPTLKQRYESVRRRIDEAARRAGRRGDDVILVAVTKFASFDQIREIIELGHMDLGENRVQHLVQRSAQVDEFLQRARQLGTSKTRMVPDSVRWHMIGSLQRNKVRKVLPLVRLIHSLDSLRLAEEIQAAASRREEAVEVLVQINASGEKSKHGVAPAATRHLIEQIDTMLNVKVRGLMSMAPLSDDPDDARPTFERTRELFEDIKRSGVVDDSFKLLSMGMTSDFETAVACGANIVRIGSAIFGAPEPESGDAPAA